ncbi:hypothetical protein VYI42_01620 [Streptococcus anginosus]|nr:hypothetical protein [Streptococcus anginosus]
MNQEHLLQMLRATIPRDNNLLETFLHYQSEHFDEPWENLLLNFMTQKDRQQTPIQVVTFETEVAAFVQASTSDEVSDLVTYTQTFGQAGLKKLTQLTDEEKSLVIEVALFNLATRFHLLDQEGTYQSISVSSLLNNGRGANLVNVYRVANNLSDRISRDIEQFLLTYEPEMAASQAEVFEENEVMVSDAVIVQDAIEPETFQEMTFHEDGPLLMARLDEDLSQLDLRTGQTKHLPAYEKLSLSQKYEILSHFDQVRNDRPKYPNFRRGDFDVEMEMTPVYDGDTLLTYLEADGSAYELQRPLTSLEESVLDEMGQTILAENRNQLNDLGIDLSQVEPRQLGVLLDATGRFRLKDKDLLLLGEYAHASVTQLALATELLQMGLTHDKARYFLTSQLDLEALRPMVFAFLQDTLTLDEAITFEKQKLKEPDLSFREWQETIAQPKEETNVSQVTPENSLVQDLLEQYPIGSMVSYKGQAFQVLGIEDANLNGLIRIQNGYTELIEQNPVLYLRTLEEITQALHIPSEEMKEVEDPDIVSSKAAEEREVSYQVLEKEEPDSAISVSENQDTVEESSTELDLFSFMEEDDTKELVSKDMISEPSPIREDIIEEVGSENLETVNVSESTESEVIPAVDFHFPEDLTDFYPKSARDKVETNVAAIRLVKTLEREHRQATSREQVLLAKYVGWGGLANDFFDEYNPKYAKEREELKALVTEKEYSDMKQSSLTAYYTDPAIIRQMWEKLEQDGFTGGKILDPSMGFRVIIVIEANSYVNIKSSRLLPKFKTQKINSWCAA